MAARNLKVSRYIYRWKNLLELEYNAELDITRNRLKNTPPILLQRQGYTLLNVNLKLKEKFFGDQIVRLTCGKDINNRNDNGIMYGNNELPFNHQFKPGTMVLISRDHPFSTKYKVLQGNILNIHPYYLEIVLLNRFYNPLSSTLVETEEKSVLNQILQNNANEMNANELDSSHIKNVEYGTWRIDLSVDETTISRI